MSHCSKYSWLSNINNHWIKPGSMVLSCMLFHNPASAVGVPGVGELPKIPAFLPVVTAVPPTSAMPIDGTWIVDVLGKKIRIEKGRAYAIDGWLHMFVLDIKPGMVTSKEIKPTGPGKYTGFDLPLMSNYTMQVSADGSLAVNVQTPLIPTNFNLLPVQLDNQAWFNQEMQAAGLQPPTASSAAPAYQFTSPPGYGGVKQQPGYAMPQQPEYGHQPGAGYGNPQTQQPGYGTPAPEAPSYGGGQPANGLAPGETPGCIRGVNC